MSDGSLNAYLFVIDSSQRSLKDALIAVDQLPEVENWQIILPDAAILISRLNVKALNQLLKPNFPNQRYLLMLVEPGKKSGWLAKKSWEFMNEPASVFEG